MIFNTYLASLSLEYIPHCVTSYWNTHADVVILYAYKDSLHPGIATDNIVSTRLTRSLGIDTLAGSLQAISIQNNRNNISMFRIDILNTGTGTGPDP